MRTQVHPGRGARVGEGTRHGAQQEARWSEARRAGPRNVCRLILGIELLGLGIAARSDAVVVPPDQAVAGKSYSEWTVAFEQWGLAMAWDARHPWRDQTGANAFRGQSGPVWFLGGGVATRRIVVPDDKWLYVSMGGVGCSTLEDDPFHGENEDELRACVERFHFQELVCEIDGVPVPELESYQVTTPMFPIELPSSNVAGVTGGGSGQSVAAGVAVILEPLSPGGHTIYLHSTIAEDPAASLQQLTYEITVVSRPTLAVRPMPGTGRLEISWSETPGFALYQADTCDPSATWARASVDSSKVENGVRVVSANSGPVQRYYRLEFH